MDSSSLTSTCSTYLSDNPSDIRGASDGNVDEVHRESALQQAVDLTYISLVVVAPLAPWLGAPRDPCSAAVGGAAELYMQVEVLFLNI